MPQKAGLKPDLLRHFIFKGMLLNCPLIKNYKLNPKYLTALL